MLGGSTVSKVFPENLCIYVDLKNEWELFRGRKKKATGELWQAWHESSVYANNREPYTKILCEAAVFLTKNETPGSRSWVRDELYSLYEDRISSLLQERRLQYS